MWRSWIVLTAITCSAGCISIKPAPLPEIPPAACVEPSPKPRPALPEVVSVPRKDCPYALCLDQKNFDALKLKLSILEDEE